MKIPLSLIKSFIHLDLQASQIATSLTLLGIEVEGIIAEHPSFAGVVAGEILSVEQHPRADKLRIAQVNDGKQILQIVCGAPNCQAGMKTALAKPGALLREADGKQRKIEKTTIRDVESLGMLCSEEELGFSPLSDGILTLPSEIKAGQDLVHILWDPVFEIALTPNLGHCMSALGLARELSAAFQKPLLRPPAALQENRKSELTKHIQAAVSDSKLCPRYMGRLIEQVKIGPSPFWLQRTLIASGIKPICNAVDIANYVMLKTGQPFHVFDIQSIQGGSLKIAPSSIPQTFLGLDGIERAIPVGAILISDALRPLAIAGILGAKNSAVTEETQGLFIEAAVFDSSSIRQTSRKMALRSESSQRFEKGIDPAGVPIALNELCALILEICGGNLASGCIDLKEKVFTPKEILCRPGRINQLLGTRFSLNEIEQFFQRLGFSSKEEGDDMLRVSVPQFRRDIEEEIDLVEEAARIYGYNAIPKPVPHYSSSQIQNDPEYLFERQIREKLTGFGLQEFLNSDLIGPKLVNAAIEWIRPGATLLTALHAKTEEYSILRPSLLPGFLQAAKNNFNHKTNNFSAFEIGRIHFLQSNILIEQSMVALLLSGKSVPSHWSLKGQDFDFFDLKGILENLFKTMRIPTLDFHPASHPTFHPGRQANIESGGCLVGSFGEIHPEILNRFDIKQRLIYAEMNLQQLLALRQSAIHMRPLPHFPASERDWTLVLPEKTLLKTVFEAIHSIQLFLLEKVELIDLYIPENHDLKNATLRFTYRDPFKTISFEEVETAHAKLIDAVSKLLVK